MKLALTGQLPFILLVATILALPISFGLLRLYRRAVGRSMRSTGESSGDQMVKPDSAPEHATSPRSPAGAVEALLHHGPWRPAIVYAIASGAHAVVMVTGVLLATRLEFFPMRVLLLLVSYAWPIVLTINLVAGTVPRTRALVIGSYFAVMVLLTAVAVIRSPQLTVHQAVVF